MQRRKRDLREFEKVCGGHLMRVHLLLALTCHLIPISECLVRDLHSPTHGRPGYEFSNPM
jgi:hypothetical protein